MSRHDLAILLLLIAALGVIAIVGLFLAGIKSAQDYPTEELPDPAEFAEYSATQPFGEHTEMSIEQALRIVRGDEGRGGTPHAGGRA